jgi:amino acid transporter
MAVSLVVTGMQNYTEIDPEAGFASAFTNVGLPVIASIISVFAVLSIMTVMLTFLLGVTRVWFSMSRDGLLPPWFAKVDSHGTPQRVTWIAGVGAALLAGIFPIRQVADLTNIGILSAFVVVCAAVIPGRCAAPPAPATITSASSIDGPSLSACACSSMVACVEKSDQSPVAPMNTRPPAVDSRPLVGAACSLNRQKFVQQTAKHLASAHREVNLVYFE